MKRYSEQTIEALDNGYDLNWQIDDSMKSEDIYMIDKLCDRIREDNHPGSCWDLIKMFDEFAHEYCKNVKKGKSIDNI